MNNTPSDKYSKIFFIADLHFGHPNIVRWRSELGFAHDTVEEHDNHLVENWNETVQPDDRVYVLGDLCWNAKSIGVIPKLNGKIYFIGGNHDTKFYERIGEFPNVKLLGGLVDYRVPEVDKTFVMSHAPLHSSQVGGDRWDYNIHGHMHHIDIGEPNYVCVSVEQIGFKPISFRQIINIYVPNNTNPL